ncbi:hypothetical protein GCM10018952_21880 [Streptosporangium vulgare]
MQIVARIRARHGVEVPVADVFTYPTVGELAQVVAGMLEAGTSPVTPIARAVVAAGGGRCRSQRLRRP